MKKLVLVMSVLLLFPFVSSAAPLTASQRATLEQELQTLETQLLTYFNSTCTSGKTWQNGSCQWTASSTEAIASENQLQQTNNQQTAIQAQVVAQEQAGAIMTAQLAQQQQTNSSDYQTFVTDMNAVTAGCRNGNYPVCNSNETTLTLFLQRQQYDHVSSQIEATELQTIQDEVASLGQMISGVETSGGSTAVKKGNAGYLSSEAALLISDESLL